MADSIGKKVLVFALGGAAFAVAFYAVHYAKVAFIDKPQVEAIENEIARQGREKGGNQPTSVADAKAAMNIGQKTLDQLAPNSKEAFEFANGNFWGFYWVNTRSRVKWCRDHGVELTKFTRAFHEKNLDGYRAALRVSKQYDFDNEQTYVVISDGLARSVHQGMRDLMATRKLSEREACEFVEMFAEAVVMELDFAKVFPAAFTTLTR